MTFLRRAMVAAAATALMTCGATGTALADKMAWSIDSATRTIYVSPAGCSADVTTTYSYASTGRLELEAFVNGVSQGVQTYGFNGKGTATVRSQQVSGPGGSSFSFTLTLLKQGAAAVVEATTTIPPSSPCFTAVPTG